MAETSKDEKEIARKRDEILKRMHKLPPKPNKDYVGDSKKKGSVKKKSD